MRDTKLELAGATIRERSITSSAVVFTSRMRSSFAVIRQAIVQNAANQSAPNDRFDLSGADGCKPDPEFGFEGPAAHPSAGKA